MRTPPLRTCTGCGQSRPKEEMVRIAADPGGRAVVDLSGKAPGRGAYVCPDPACLARAAKGRLAAVLKAERLEGGDAASLAEGIAAALRERMANLLGLAQRQGKAASGTNMVEGELRREPRRDWLLVVAEDASADVTQKVLRRAEEIGIAVAILPTRDEIGLALGKSPRSAVLVKDGSLARTLAETAARWRALKGPAPGQAQGGGVEGQRGESE